MRQALWAGAKLFNAGHWWEAHEAWETEWMRATGQERQFVQGLILLAAALHKRWVHGSQTSRNYEKARIKLTALPDEYGGLHLPALLADVQHALQVQGYLPQLPGIPAHEETETLSCAAVMSEHQFLPLVSLGDLTWDVLAKPDTMLLPGGDTTGRLELSGGGSAANLAVWARRADYPATFIGKIGKDRFGELAKHELARENVNVQVIESEAHPTGVILALIDRRGQRAMLTGQGADWELLPEELPAGTLQGACHLHLTAWSLFRDPPRAAALEAARLAKAAGATLSFDPGSFQMIQQMGRDSFLSMVDGIPFDVIFPNDDEARAMSGRRQHERALDWMRERYPHALVVLKMDEDGALIEGPQTQRVHVPATQDKLVDATGAGDAFGGAFLAGWLRHRDAQRAAQLAVQVGGWVVSRFGARPPADEELTRRLAVQA